MDFLRQSKLTFSASTSTDVIKEIDFNEILEKHVGGWGRYQWQYLFVFAIVTMELSYVTYSPVLYLYVPDSYECSAPPGKKLYLIFVKLY